MSYSGGSEVPRATSAVYSPSRSKEAGPNFFTRARLEWLSFFLLGTLNNLSYVVVNSAAKTIADSFNQGNLIGVIVWANVGFGIAVRALNTWYGSHFTYTHRIIMSIALCAAGCIVVAVGTWINFWVCITGVVLIGNFSSLGESVLLGYLKDFDPSLMGAWSSGTGMAGVGGTLLYLLLFSVMGISNRIIFFALTPLIIFYWTSFQYVHRRFLREFGDGKATGGASINSISTDSDSVGGAGKSTTPPLDAAKVSVRDSLLRNEESPTSPTSEHGFAGDEFESEQSENEPRRTLVSVAAMPVNSDMADDPYADESEWARTKRISVIIFSLAFQLASVYFFEYVVSVGFASKANHTLTDAEKALGMTQNWFEANAYELLAFMYQVGVLIARSSLSWFPVKRIFILTLLQLAQFVIWFIHVERPFIPLWLQFIDMAVVGLFGGSMYVNVFALLVTSDELSRKKDKELGINLTAIAINLGIVVSSVFEIILFVTVMKDK